MQRLSIARSFRLALVGLTLVLAVIAGFGVASLYNRRQRYENTLSATGALTTAAANLTLLVQPMFGGTQPTFGLGAEANGVSLKWTCPFTRDIERLALPVPPQALGNASSLDIHVHLTGSPTRDSDYLLVYTSSRLGGPVISLQGSPAPEAPLTMCALASA